ncbi:hypothetical protein SAMN06265795_10438 [Noviherbaspirillum humi]|uniref:Colicin import membrane protein n=1 Tax=Noviherbaspirillum humi TaxID=1688639 RepID=A0A239FPI7_9BURK|nr:hypothetical protein [Noviherbaspirillum humi]SNS58780.1 hypothetical protein SAMN06265795_10438 [Noviherbaspirillum humi]
MSPVRFPSVVHAAWLVFALLLMAFSPARADDHGDMGAGRVVQQYPAGSIQSAEAADEALAAVASAKQDIAARAAQQEQLCTEKFFASDCMDAVKERRRKALAAVRPIEVEANAYKRRAQIEERDRGLAERNAREAPPPGLPRTPKPSAPAKAQPPSESAAGVNPRVARHEEKLRKLEAEEKAGEAKRAAKVEAYNRKVQESEERQREVEEKRRQREEEARQKAAAAKP